MKIMIGETVLVGHSLYRIKKHCFRKIYQQSRSGKKRSVNATLEKKKKG